MVERPLPLGRGAFTLVFEAKPYDCDQRREGDYIGDDHYVIPPVDTVEQPEEDAKAGLKEHELAHVFH